MSDPASLPPGFRFHPTDEELILHYLRNQAASLPCPVSIIAEVDIYKHDPWDLPAKALFGEREWYFFSPRVRKYPKGVRPNRAAASGYWKATGTDKPIHASLGSGSIGVKKALVFYKGRPPKGRKTNWIMHEYRLAEAQTSCNYKPLRFKDSSMKLDDWVLCRIYKKNSKLHQSVPPLMDQEQEDTVSEDIYSSSLQNVEEPSSLGLHKSLSITDLLEDFSTVSHLFDNLPEMQGSELESLVGQPSISQLLADNNSSRNDDNNNNKLVQQKVQEESPAPIAASSTKRNGAAISAEFFNQFDSSQCNFLLR